MSKDKKDAASKGGKGKKKKGGADVASGEIRLSEHPRARHQIRLAKSWGGIGGLALAGWAAWHGGAPPVDAALRALLWGVCSYVLVWFCAVQVWRHLAIAEVKAAENMWLARRAEVEQSARDRQTQADKAAAVGGNRA